MAKKKKVKGMHRMPNGKMMPNSAMRRTMKKKMKKGAIKSKY